MSDVITSPTEYGKKNTDKWRKGDTESQRENLQSEAKTVVTS